MTAQMAVTIEPRRQIDDGDVVSTIHRVWEQETFTLRGRLEPLGIGDRMSEHLVKHACETSELCVFHIGFRECEMRIFLGVVDSDHPTHVIELHAVHSFFDRGIISGEPVLFMAQQGAGSFGFDLSEEERKRHQEVFLRMKADELRNPFRAIVGRVVEREVEYPGEENWPG